ncbi:MAG TPA: helix-turn-helix domain-containing protein [Rugosimonospora sp.]
MENLSLPPATQDVLDALTDLGQGNVHELADKSGRARSTTDKALKTLAEAGLIVAVDTGADPAEGTPTRWQLANPAGGTQPVAADPAEIHDGDSNNIQADDPAEEQPATGTEQHDGDGTSEDDEGSEDQDDEDDFDSDADEDDEDDSDDDGDEDEDSADEAQPARPSRPADRKVMAIRGVLSDYPEGTTADIIADMSGFGHAVIVRLLSAMEQADAARRIPADTEAGTPERWTPGPGKASDVDPNPAPPRCHACGQVIRTQRVTSTTSTAAGRGSTSIVSNNDGSRPFARGELYALTITYINARPGQTLTPQEIASGISAELDGRDVSSGAVRNNCTKAAAAGKVLLATEEPVAVKALPAIDGDGDGDGEQ